MQRERAARTVCCRVSAQAADFLHRLGGELYLKHVDGHNAFSLHGSSVRVAIDYLILVGTTASEKTERGYDEKENLYVKIVRKEKEIDKNVMEKQSKK